MPKSLPCPNSTRLSEVVSLVQLLGPDEHVQRSEEGLSEELQGKPKSACLRSDVAPVHPEFSGYVKTECIANH